MTWLSPVADPYAALLRNQDPQQTIFAAAAAVHDLE